MIFIHFNVILNSLIYFSVEENTYFVENIEKDLPIININNLNETKQLSENKSQ